MLVLLFINWFCDISEQKLQRDVFRNSRIFIDLLRINPWNIIHEVLTITLLVSTFRKTTKDNRVLSFPIADKSKAGRWVYKFHLLLWFLDTKFRLKGILQVAKVHYSRRKLSQNFKVISVKGIKDKKNADTYYLINLRLI